MENTKETKDLEPTSIECGVDIDGEMEHLERMKERYAELYKKVWGEIKVESAYWSDEYGRAMVHYNVVVPKNHEEYEFEMRMLASDILHAQNLIAKEKEIKRYMVENRKDKENENQRQ